MDLNQLIEAEELQLKKLNELVVEAVQEESYLSHKILELEEDSNLKFSQKIADKVADFGGSWTFILSFAVFIIIWIIINVYLLTGSAQFDPYPFILLNLILSCIAALQAPVIMMSQNRQEEKDRRRSRSDYMVNMKAEMEVRALHKKIDLLMVEQMQHLFKIQQAQLDILDKLKEHIMEGKK